MKTLMYPIAPDDDFPEMFCAIRQGSDEHWFYTPEGESASWMLFRAVSENAKLREVIDDITEVVEVSDPALVQFIAKRMSRIGVDE